MSDFAAALGKMYTRRDETKEVALHTLSLHGPQFSVDGDDRYFDTPFTMIDAEGNILAWYLPDVISSDAHVRSNVLLLLFLLMFAIRENGWTASRG